MAFSAGIINIVGLIGFGRETVSHLTGNTSLLAEEIAKGSVSGALHYLVVILSFFAGTLLYSAVQNRAMYVPAGISLAAAAAYWWIRVRAPKSGA